MTFPPPGPPEQTPADPGPYGPPQPAPAPAAAPEAGQPGAWGPGPAGYAPHGPVPTKKSNALAITGFVLAVVGLLLCLIPIINVFAAVLALAGLVLGIIGLLQSGRLGSGKGLSIAAIVISVVAGIGAIVSQIVYVAALDELTASLEASSVTSTVPDEPADEQTTADELFSDEVPALALAFGDVAAFEDGLEVGASAPAPFTPAEWASGGDGFTQFVRIDVTLTNGTAEAFDPTLTYVTLSSVGAEGSQVFDPGNGIVGSPTTSLLPGQSVTFPVVFGVNDPADLTLEVGPGAWEYDAVIFSTTA
ncbi:DUF4190 domain-containing protein [Oerskovia turbata]